MSAFLAPIHFWLYNKIIVQERLTKAIADGGKERGWTALTTGTLVRDCVNSDEPTLESIIDQDNIHAWLQVRIIDAEARYARLVNDILKENASRLEDLKQIAYDFGVNNPLKECKGATEAYRALNAILLDGMPCDRINQPLEQGEEIYRWQRAKDIHGARWTEIGAAPEIYYILRSAFTKGIFANSGFDFVDYQDGRYEIVKQ